MHDDPFERAVGRMKAAERAESHERRRRTTRHARGWASYGTRLAFRIHLSVFLAVNLLLIVIWATATQGFPWFIYVLAGWGIGLVAHWAATADLMGRRRRR